MLERTAGQLVESVEALALEELFITFNSGPGHRYVYVPVIVTNSDLQICRFKMEAVPLANGRLPEDAGEFEQVPFVRFRKTLTVRPTKYTLVQTLRDSHRDKTRTVFVVNAERLADFLAAWSFGTLEGHPPLAVTV